jgi:D-alanine-D-alanine ligase
MRVAVVFDDVDSWATTLFDRSVLQAVAAVEAALAQLGHQSFRVPVDSEGKWVAGIEKTQCDVAFNLCEAVAGISALEPAAAGVLELLRIPMTGCSAETLSLARRKDRVNAVLQAEGLPVPAWLRVPDGQPPTGWNRFPALVKPAGEDASLGITQSSVACDDAGLARAVDAARAFGPLLVQELIDGREFNVGFLGDEILPVAEIELSTLPPGYWRIVSWAAKWEPGSIEDLGSVPRCPAVLPKDQAAHLTELARRAWNAVEGRGYGRVDMRLDADGNPWILEVNPNPDLSRDAGMTRMAAAARLTYTDLIGRILEEATARAGEG